MTYASQRDIFLEEDPEKLATFIQEYVRRDGADDAGSVAVIAAGLRDPRWLPHHVAEHLLAKPEIQAGIKILRAVYKPTVGKEVSADTISMDMETLYQEAKDARQFTAAISAKKLQAELFGLVNKEINVNVRHTAATMADSALEAIAKRGAIDAEFTDVTPASGLPAIVDIS